MVSDVVHRNALPKGFRLNEYTIEGVLGDPGGFGIAYLARDTNLDQMVAIKEYLPNDLAMREGTTVYPKSTHDNEDFTWGLDRFLEEAKTLARFNHPNIVQVLRYFQANSTGYMVMRYEDGLPLNEILKENHLNEEELVQNILLPLIDGLKQVHAAGFLHRDIKPGNIYMRRSDETPVLLDFGAARNALGSKSKSLTSIVTAGYAPFEQYHSDGNQGPWSDIYALGAVAYRIVTGEKPPEAPSRIRKDKMISAVDAAKGKYSEKLLAAIDHALVVDEEDRPKSFVAWRNEITENASSTVTHPKDEFNNEKKTLAKKSKDFWFDNKCFFLPPIYFSLILIVCGVLLDNLSGNDFKYLALFSILLSFYGLKDVINCSIGRVVTLAIVVVGYWLLIDQLVPYELFDSHSLTWIKYVINGINDNFKEFSIFPFTAIIISMLLFRVYMWKKAIVLLLVPLALARILYLSETLSSLSMDANQILFLIMFLVGIKVMYFNDLEMRKMAKLIFGLMLIYGLSMLLEGEFTFGRVTYHGDIIVGGLFLLPWVAFCFKSNLLKKNRGIVNE